MHWLAWCVRSSYFLARFAHRAFPSTRGSKQWICCTCSVSLWCLAIHNNPTSLKETRISLPSHSLLICVYQSVIRTPQHTHTHPSSHCDSSPSALHLPPSHHPHVHMRCVVKHPMIYGALIWLSPIHCFVLRMAVGCPADSNFPPVGEDCVSWANGTLNPHPAYGLWWGAGGWEGGGGVWNRQESGVAV